MPDEQKRAAEIQEAVEAADRKKRADADQEAAVGQKLDKLLEHMGSMSVRLDALEARGRDGDDADDDEGDEDDNEMEQPGKPRRVAADSADSQLRHAARLAEIQERADAVAHEYGEKAPPPMSAETERRYRIRLLRRYKHHSPDWKEIDLDKINDPKIFDAAESRIYADARANGAVPEVPDGHLRERVRTDASGRRISEFFGSSPRVWMKTFSGNRRYVRSIRSSSK
jgi:hypothetical protein